MDEILYLQDVLIEKMTSDGAFYGKIVACLEPQEQQTLQTSIAAAKTSYEDYLKQK